MTSKTTKDQCIEIAPKGWEYNGIDRDDLGQVFYIYQTGNYQTGFKELLALECDMEEDNLQSMADNNMSRIMGFDYSDYDE
jgi:hypothetical protein